MLKRTLSSLWVGTVITSAVFTHSVALSAASVDQDPPLDAHGNVIPLSIATSGDDMCWADPSPEGRVVTSPFGNIRSEGSSPHAGIDIRAHDGVPVYSVADGCVSFGNPTPKQLVGVKIRINDKFPNSSVWYLHLSRVAPKFINDGRSGQCIPIKKGELVGYSGNNFGTRGKIVQSGTAHLHLSYYVSGLMINPAPVANPPAIVPPEYNTIKNGSQVAGGTAINDSDASGTRGSKLGFAVPRMCNEYTVSPPAYKGQKTIPYNGDFGIGNFQANATAPTRQQLEDGAQRVKQSMGVDGEGKAPSSEKIDTENWTSGLIEAPDWESYKDMSFHQIIHAEVARRSANSRWHEQLTELDPRGIQLEHLRLQAVRLSVQHELHVVRQRTEAMMAAYLAATSRKIRLDPLNLSSEMMKQAPAGLD